MQLNVDNFFVIFFFREILWCKFFILPGSILLLVFWIIVLVIVAESCNELQLVLGCITFAFINICRLTWKCKVLVGLSVFLSTSCFLRLFNDVRNWSGLYGIWFFCYQNLPSDAAIGVDPWCVSVDTAQRWELAFSRNKQKLIQLTTNLVDEVWKNRPSLEIQPVTVQPLEFAGRSVEEKLKDLREKLSQENAFSIIVAALDEVSSLYPFPTYLFYLFIYIVNELLVSSFM